MARKTSTRSTRTAKKAAAKTAAAKKAATKKAAKKPAARRDAAKASRPRKPAAKSSAKSNKSPARKPAKAGTEPVRLSGGNPQIAKGYGDAPVQSYIAAMPGWKSEIGRRLDALIMRTVPGVSKAVKWNSPLYGIEGRGWFLGIHVFTRYVKVAFFRGASLTPIPPGESSQSEVRYLDIHEEDRIDEAQFADWVKQASLLPGERM